VARYREVEHILEEGAARLEAALGRDPHHFDPNPNPRGVAARLLRLTKRLARCADRVAARRERFRGAAAELDALLHAAERGGGGGSFASCKEGHRWGGGRAFVEGLAAVRDLLQATAVPEVSISPFDDDRV